jgi:hypothetical protein
MILDGVPARFVEWLAPCDVLLDLGRCVRAHAHSRANCGAPLQVHVAAEDHARDDGVWPPAQLKQHRSRLFGGRGLAEHRPVGDHQRVGGEDDLVGRRVIDSPRLRQRNVLRRQQRLDEPVLLLRDVVWRRTPRQAEQLDQLPPPRRRRGEDQPTSLR